MTDKLDVYSALEVPFDVATWARGHRYSPTAVDIAKNLRRKAELRKELEATEKAIEETEATLTTLIEAARDKMGSTQGV